jgi:GxxExxY protein
MFITNWDMVFWKKFTKMLWLLPYKSMGVMLLNNFLSKSMLKAKLSASIIVELKAGDSIVEAYEAQLTNYLKATDIEVGLLLNFGVKPEFRRKVFTKSIRK